MTPVLVAPATAAFADAVGATPTTDTTVTTPAPPASSSATALDVAGIVTIGQTSATAGSGSQSASGTALALGGTPVSGGSAATGKKADGNIFDSGATPLGSLAIAPWDADSSQPGKASSNAALARVTVIDGKTIAINVLQAHSDAHYNGNTSKSSSSSDGATVSLGDGALFLDVLHADSASGAKGSSYLVAINGNEIGSSEQAAGQCAINVPGLLNLLCLTATGGAGTTTTSASVATAQLAGGALPTGTISSVTASGQPTARTPATTTVKGEKIPNSGTPTSSGSTGKLPFTGLPALALLALGAALTVTGAGLQRVRHLGRLAG